jgi:hypothetical protein
MSIVISDKIFNSDLKEKHGFCLELITSESEDLTPSRYKLTVSNLEQFKTRNFDWHNLNEFEIKEPVFLFTEKDARKEAENQKRILEEKGFSNCVIRLRDFTWH